MAKFQLIGFQYLITNRKEVHMPAVVNSLGGGYLLGVPASVGNQL